MVKEYEMPEKKKGGFEHILFLSAYLTF